MTRAAACWVLGIALAYSVMFATGALLFDDMRQLAMFGAVALASGITLVAVMRTGSVQNGVVATWR